MIGFLGGDLCVLGRLITTPDSPLHFLTTSPHETPSLRLVPTLGLLIPSQATSLKPEIFSFSTSKSGRKTPTE